MQSLGIDVLFKGTNFLRLLGGLWVALRISLISVAISIVLGIGMGMLMTSKSRILKVIFRVYLEIVRIMPQMVLLFVVYFGTTRVFGWNLEAEAAAGRSGAESPACTPEWASCPAPERSPTG